MGKLTEVNTILLEIRGKSGDNYAEISIPYSKGDKLTLEYARIEDQQGNIIRVLKKGEISEKSNISDISLFEDNYIKSFELKHNVYPYRVRYQWKYTYSHFQEIIRWIPFIDNKVPTEYARLEVQTPVGFPVKIFRNGIDNFKCDTTTSGVTYSFEATRLKFPDKENNAFPAIKYASQVWMVPEKFTWL
ncbi:MAG: DUF3857 domain-containing protein [Bacteroidales bacterium]|nr:DUF3857 domain-containing protein [Bacteroidales bacterium]